MVIRRAVTDAGGVKLWLLQWDGRLEVEVLISVEVGLLTHGVDFSQHQDGILTFRHLFS